MQAVSFEQGQACLHERPVPEPEEGEALIRVRLAGICATDLELLRGYQDFSGQPGHEFVGHVAGGDIQPDMLGQRVVADINCGCGTCSWCMHQEPRHCPQRQVLGIKNRDGAFAEYICLPVKSLHLVDEGIPDKEAVLAEPLAAALRVTQQMHLTVDLKLAVLGDGTLGILTALALSRLMPRLTLIGRHADKLSIAAQQGVSILRPGPGRERSGLVGHSNAFDVVIEATGSPQGLDLALDLIRPQGAVVLKTTTCEPTRSDTSRIAVKEIRVLGSRCGNLDQALLFLRNRWLDLAPLVSGVYPLAELPAALEHARSPGSLKVLLSP